jgi:hypothetical protein
VKVFKSIRTKLGKRFFNWRAGSIKETPPAPVDPEATFVVLTQLYPPDLTMYLVAVKSFARYVVPREYIIVDDGLSDSDRDIITRNLGKVRFIRIGDVDLDTCPTGGCWERLCAIASLNADTYVIQLDADTLTVNRPDEVLDCLSQGRSFTLGTYYGRELTSLDDISQYAASIDSEHVQVKGEAAFAHYPDKGGYRYVRGCAGFAGFSPGAARLGEISAFSSTMSGLVGGEKWAEWGSEQLTSNFFVANANAPVVLPVESYPFMSDKVDPRSCKLIHFYGSARFAGGLYAKLATELITELRSR